jgi:hypothetical protein
VGVAAAWALSRLDVAGRPIWPGIPLQLTGLALIVAALVAGHGVRKRLAGYSFGWRQLTAAIVAVAAALLPVLAGVTWLLRGADDPLARGGTRVLPAFAAAEVEGTPGLRALTLAPRRDGRLGYDLVRGDGPSLAVTGLRATPGQRRALDRVVADLASPRGSDAAEALSTRAVRYVALRDELGSADVRNALDAQPGLVRRTSGSVDVWRVIAPSNRLSVLDPALAQHAVAGDRAPSPQDLRAHPPTALQAGPEGASVDVPDGDGGRLLVLADAREGGWHARLDGKALRATTAWGWAQAFELPADGGHLELSHSQRGRRAALITELLLVAGALLLSVPGGRRRAGLEDDVDVEDDEPQPMPKKGASL